jgi:hypothetical protein
MEQGTTEQHGAMRKPGESHEDTCLLQEDVASDGRQEQCEGDAVLHEPQAAANGRRARACRKVVQGAEGVPEEAQLLPLRSQVLPKLYQHKLHQEEEVLYHCAFEEAHRFSLQLISARSLGQTVCAVT